MAARLSAAILFAAISFLTVPAFPTVPAAHAGSFPAVIDFSSLNGTKELARFV
jgi:hypothetical protein